MSLINDALRRAKQAQQDTPPGPAAPVPHFRPVETGGQPIRHGLGLLLPAGVFGVALLALLLLWELSKRDGSATKTQLPVAARTLSAPHATPSGAENVTTGLTRSGSDMTGKPGGLTAPDPVPALADPNSPHSVATDAFSGTNSVSNGSDSADTNHAAASEATVAPPAPLKLQSIVYNPKRPSAMINGRVVFLGDRIRDYRVQAIHAEDVVLSGPGKTNVLSLEP